MTASPTARIAVLAGGRSPERDISLRSGHRVASALADLPQYDTVILDPADVPLVEGIAAGSFDACYLALHGKEGEDGTVQRLLDLVGVAYTGTLGFACEVAFDKVLAKDVLFSAGVRTPAWVVIEAAALRDLGAGAALGRVTDRVGFPVVVKPARSGSALGVAFVEREADLATAIMGALSYSEAVVVERKVEGTEIAAGIVGSPAEALPLIEIEPKSGVYDYASRYTAGATEYYAPARVAPEVASAVAGEAMRSMEALGLRDVARVDLMVDRAGTPWVLEVNVSPGMTETSLLPMAAKAAGHSLSDLCDRVVRAALGRARS
ncbi:MAG: D-alanine--D-alanine ligase [Actinomycetota bacterium]